MVHICSIQLFSRFASRVGLEGVKASPKQVGLNTSTRTVSSSAMATVNISNDEMVKIIPPLGFDHHKGQHGRIGVVGGCREYTGAPYFAAMAALRLGADLSHVFCTSDAAIPIKCYSPDLIVHPLLDAESAVEQIKQWLPRLHCMVIGPGLGRNDDTYRVTKDLLNFLKGLEIPTVIDGDGLFLIQQDLSLVRDATNFTLTPNGIEYKRLMNSALPGAKDDSVIENITALSQSLGGVTIVKKGETDIVACKDSVSIVKEIGSPRRCGGQGDILAGAVGLFSHWAKEAVTTKRLRVLDYDPFRIKLTDNFMEESTNIPSSVLGAYTACYFMKHLTRDVFTSINNPSTIGRSMVTNDLVDNIGKSFQNLFKV